jgi:ferrous iron transport protein B
MNIALVGNPNVGKSVIFNALTGKYVTVSNYPGTTVEVAKGSGKFGHRTLTVIDTPGVNSLVAQSEDEAVTSRILSGGDIIAIVQVADAKNLKRSLVLTLELAALRIPMVLVLNMSDEALDRGISIDTKKLSEKLGVDVIETIAVTGEGIGKLKEAILKVRVPSIPADHAAAHDGIAALKKRGKIVDGIVKDVARFSKPLTKNVAETIGRLTTRPLTGVPILLAILAFMYVFVGRFAAGTCVNFLEEKVFGGFLNPFFTTMADRYMPIPLIKDLLVGQYGIITMAFTYAFAIIFPIVTAFFLFFGVLEDSGYLPRLSVLSDRVFKTMGLNGRAILPMILGLGCGTMATLTARILDTKKERIIVSLLLTLAIPCSAQLGVILGMLGSISPSALLIWIVIILSVMLVVGGLAAKVVPGAPSAFIQELPPIRMPQLKNIAIKTFLRLKWYLKEAVPLFLAGTLVLFVFNKIGILGLIEKLLSPLIVNLLNLPNKATEAFIIGFLRRDYGAAGLYALAKEGALDHIQILVSLVVITLFVPCIAQFLVTIKERGARVAAIIGAFVFIFAFLAGGAVNFVLRYLLARGITVI